MLKTIKGKVIAGTVTLALISGAGAAYASSDAGVNLQNWYNVKFNLAKTEVGFTTLGYSVGEFWKLNNNTKNVKAVATNDINKVKNDSANNSKNKIDGRAQEHIKATNDQKAIISDYMDDQFNSIVNDSQKVLNKTAEVNLSLINNELERHSVKQGTLATDYVNTELSNSTTKAVSDLQSAISDAKSALEEQLKGEKGASITKVKGLIDAKINELQGLIKEENERLIGIQKEIIEKAAQELEVEAIRQLDALVTGINGK